MYVKEHSEDSILLIVDASRYFPATIFAYSTDLIRAKHAFEHYLCNWNVLTANDAASQEFSVTSFCDYLDHLGVKLEGQTKTGLESWRLRCLRSVVHATISQVHYVLQAEARDIFGKDEVSYRTYGVLPSLN